MDLFTVIIIYLIVLIVVIIFSKILAYFTIPKIKDPIINKDSFNNYFKQIYSGNGLHDVPLLIKYNDEGASIMSLLESKPETGLINIKNTLYYFNFLWDSCPDSIKNEYSLSPNLSMKWPPSMNTRYKLTAMPYPKSKSILTGIYQLISNTADSVTFPGWFISRYNPQDFNNNIYNDNYFNDNQLVEVTHACYAPPGQKYPFCDDGGWWAYLTVGSGVFWDTGKCIVAKNKLDLLNKLYIKSLGINGLSIDDLTNILIGKGGGFSITKALYEVIDSLEHSKKPKALIGFKTMKQSEMGKGAWSSWISSTFILIYLIIILIIYLIKNFSFVNLGIILVLISVYLYFWAFVFSENLIRGFGWMTLDMALKETNMSIKEFVIECVNGTLRNPVCNSLAMTQIFDLHCEIEAKKTGYDSFILTTQPNKSGSWAVEICDLRNFTENKNIALDNGICGGFKKSGEPNIKFKKGPLEMSIYKPYFCGKATCSCNEKKNYKCVSCVGTLSDKMCKN